MKGEGNLEGNVKIQVALGKRSWSGIWWICFPSISPYTPTVKNEGFLKNMDSWERTWIEREREIPNSIAVMSFPRRNDLCRHLTLYDTYIIHNIYMICVTSRVYLKMMQELKQKSCFLWVINNCKDKLTWSEVE